ncbi:MAG TPA: DNRLRE domain-containing protein, partial [Candidatus Limnocylindria bacterium]|nr:DNRLRE domain-containing protein [Candidatus Limnocylindria bacterium]
MVALIVTAWLWPSGASPQVASAATTVTVPPVADAWVDSSAPSANFGTNNRLKVMAASRRFESFMRFSVSGVGAVSSARLRLFVADGSTDGGTVHLSIGPWSEGGVIWSNRPATGMLVGSLGAAVSKTWIEVD